MPSLSLICPTIGRTTLERLFESVIPQMKDGDEFIIVGDGMLPDEAYHSIGYYLARCWKKVRYIELPERVGDFGCSPCDKGISEAKGDAIFVIGDDDWTAPGAFDAIRAAVLDRPDVPHLFAMHHTSSTLQGSLTCGLVSSQQMVVPRDMDKMPLMADVTEAQWCVSDWVWMMKVHEAWGERTIFHQDVIAVLEGQHGGGFL